MNVAAARELIRFLRPSDLEGAEALWAENCARRWRLFHETYTVCIGLELRGPEFEWTYRRRLYRSGIGKVMLMEPGEVHANTRPTAPAAFRVLFLPPKMIAEAAQELGLPGPPHFGSGFSGDPLVFDLFARLHESLEDPSATTLERQSRLASCVRAITERCTDAPRRKHAEEAGRASLARVRELLADHLTENVTLEDLAAISGLSRFHLVRAFRKAFGAPPHRYQMQMRLARARTLLAAGWAPARVAAELCFTDQSHLNLRFRQFFGVTAGQYRDASAISS